MRRVSGGQAQIVGIPPLICCEVEAGENKPSPADTSENEVKEEKPVKKPKQGSKKK